MNEKIFKLLILILVIFVITVVAVLVFSRTVENNILPKQKKEIIINQEADISQSDIKENKTIDKKEPISESPIRGPLLN